MAARIRRFVQDCTELPTATGHDLRTPITRLKLRAGFIEDEEQQRKILADLEELEAMVSATLAFGRDAASAEPVSPLDLAELLRTVLDEAGDARPEVADRLTYQGPSHVILRARPLAMKRALANLLANAVSYGGSARVRLISPVSIGAAEAKGLSREVGQFGITVNSIPPGRIMSEQIRRNYPEDYRKQFAETEIPVRYWGESEDLAVMAVWLASPLARYVTGTVIPVDGGLRRYQF